MILIFSLSLFLQIANSKAPPDFEEKRIKVLNDYKKTIYEINSSSECLKKSSYVYSFIKKYGDDTIYSERLRRFLVKRCIKEGKMGICCDDGSRINDNYYDFISPFYNGYSLVRNNNMWGVMDISGNIVFGFDADKQKVKDELKKLREKFPSERFIYTQLERFKYFIVEEGELIIDRTGGGVGFLDKEGKIVIPKLYEDVKGFSDEEICPVKLNGKWGFINKKNEVVIPFNYEDADAFCEGLAAVKVNGKWGFIDVKGRMVVKNRYDFVISFSEGRAVVNKNGKYGYVDYEGNEIIKVVYDDAESFSDGIAKVKKGNKNGYVDRFGNECCFK